MNKKPIILVGFSSGKTSCYMSYWMKKNLSKKYELIFVFANTGKEREESLIFADKCDKYFGLNLVWIEAITNPEPGKGVKAKIVDFNTASRNGEPFEQSIAKHGMPNLKNPICTRELKARAMRAYARQSNYKNYKIAIGIRKDEFDRVNPNRIKENIIYPLIEMIPTKKTEVNEFWINQPFDLKIKSYEGNCDVCWKKSIRKLMTLAKDKPELFDWWKEMEEKYQFFTPTSRQHNPKIKPPHRFFREGKSVNDILKMAEMSFKIAKDDSQQIDRQLSMFPVNPIDLSNGCEESCEPF